MGKMLLPVFAILLWTTTVASWAKIIYVKAGATGQNNGTSWSNAHKDLQAALGSAASGDEIWVAAGTYKPTANADRTKSHVMKSGTKIYGGFKGTETARSQRVLTANISILSGDIGTQGIATDNSHHVVTGASRATLDGFTITGGASTDRFGGGVFGDRVTSLTVTHCTFSGNSAGRGGGIYTTGSTTVVSYCAFTGNSAGFGGGMYCQDSTLTLAQCTFTANTAKYVGGGFAASYAYKSLQNRISVSDCIFSGNSVTTFESLGGGGICLESGSIQNCDFIGNTSKSNGGGLTIASETRVINCAFSKNTASWLGGGIFNDAGDVINCVMSGNSAGNGGGGIEFAGDGELIHCTIIGNSGGGLFDGSKISNCIILGNSTADVGGNRRASIFTCCNIKNWNTTMGRDGGGNISAVPLFMNESTPAGPDGVWRTADDGLRLQSTSPCINAVFTGYAPATDILGNSRIGPADIGAYECQSPSVKNSVSRWILYQ